LPRVRQALEDAELFFKKNKSALVVLDEIHRLANPSEVLKIAADHFPDTKVIATGSSTLAVKAKFSDTLTGRKRELWLLPAIIEDLASFGLDDLDRRMLHGGLPPFLFAKKIKDEDFTEWMESYWAKDVIELFRVEKRGNFLKFIELLFRQSGELFEAQSFSTPCEISRQTVQNYLGILESTLLAIVVRPYHEGSAVEIKSQPKVYGFDTGFICFFRGISALRDEDRGLFLEHLVLGELLSCFNRSQIYYWRNKQKHEIDFVIKLGRSEKLLAIECKSQAKRFSGEALKSFRLRYPKGENLLVSLEDHPPYSRSIKDMEVQIVGVKFLRKFLQDLSRN
jgi:predicted AAA+ superfamily ATPase